MPIYIKNRQRSTRLDRKRIERDLSRALHLLELQTSELSVVFVNSRYMRELNSRYRGLDKTTDVLSFPMDTVTPENGLLGDIVICMPVAVLQAGEYATSLHEELQRLLVHGLLHLIGYDHEAGASMRRKMKLKEKALLHALATMD